MLNFTTAQDILADLGKPSRIFYKEEDKMKIHSVTTDHHHHNGSTVNNNHPLESKSLGDTTAGGVGGVDDKDKGNSV